ncbi:MAG: hypothetical protein A2047_01020 [Omnitrophica bacterium GWA2_41_15]|nr:MAG: hypothetical protein A2047_01020 [Omnitrophica bacterium GWA2_41_15]
MSKRKRGLIMKLFIYIPTYSRPEALRKSLGTLVHQAKKYADRVRIMVSDNDSPGCVNDGILSEFVFENLSFRKNPSNIGGNANMNLGFVFAKKDEFLWILGDDDYLCDNALDKIFSCDGDLDLILLTHISSPALSNYSIERSYKEWMSFFVSANIFNMKTFGVFIENVFYYHNTSYPHVAIQWLAAMTVNRQLKMMMLPLSGMIVRTVSTENNTGENYSLAWTGALGLVTILEKSEGSKFAIFWLRHYGINLLLYKNRFPHNYEQSISIILKLPMRVKLVYYETKIRYYFFLVSWKVMNAVEDKDGNIPFVGKSLLQKVKRIVVKDNSVLIKQFIGSADKNNLGTTGSSRHSMLLLSLLRQIKRRINSFIEVPLWIIRGRPIPPPHSYKVGFVKKIAKAYKLKTFIETGTYNGDMVAKEGGNFEKIISIELSRDLFLKAKQRFEGVDLVELYHGDSGSVLCDLLKHITQPCLFWLDAHYSGTGTTMGIHETPILSELECILSHQVKSHVILVDDARLFDGNSSYPALEALQQFVKEYGPDYSVTVLNDIIQIWSPSAFGEV